mmetsp:Transcript_97811/g.258334  ORF Transcript_97811/g.258334 Transcript_97811/m.258334 type:complete len:80 (+) Transcript_97811:626-865(+)
MQPAEDKVLLCEKTFHFNCPALRGLRERISHISPKYCCDYCGQDINAHESFLECTSCDVGACTECQNNAAAMKAAMDMS